jgi:Fe-S-cluster-containing dehydrogenase component
MSNPTLLINLQRCTGCWTCSLACKVGNQLADDEWWQHVRTLGSGEGIDRPAGVWPNLHMSWIPIHTQDCTLCGGRTAQGQEPFCVHNCPNGAMTYGDLDDPQSAVAAKLKDLRERGYRIFKLPEWERSRAEIVYASKG